MENEQMRRANEYDVSTESYVERKAQQGNDERMRKVNEYDVSTNAYVEWKSQQGEVAHIRLVGTATEDQINDLAELFDHRDYETITIDALSVADVVYDNGARYTYEEKMNNLVEWNERVQPPLIKMIMNRENGNEFRVTKEGDIFTSDMRILIHMQQVPETLVLDGIERIGNFAFYWMDGIKHITLVNGLQYIGEYAFAGVGGVDTLILPDSITDLGKGAFNCCDIENLRLSRNLRIIPDQCFCLNYLEYLEIPSSVREIGSRAFHGNYLKEVVIPEGVERIGDDSFSYLFEIELPASLKKIASDFYHEYILHNNGFPPYVRISADNPVFYAKDGSLYFRGNDKLALDSCYNGIPDSYYNR